VQFHKIDGIIHFFFLLFSRDNLFILNSTENSEITADNIDLNIIWKSDWRGQNRGENGETELKLNLVNLRGWGKDDVKSNMENMLFTIFNQRFWFFPLLL
jgi:hypothetical protein